MCTNQKDCKSYLTDRITGAVEIQAQFLCTLCLDAPVFGGRAQVNAWTKDFSTKKEIEATDQSPLWGLNCPFSVNRIPNLLYDSNSATVYFNDVKFQKYPKYALQVKLFDSDGTLSTDLPDYPEGTDMCQSDVNTNCFSKTQVHKVPNMLPGRKYQFIIHPVDSAGASTSYSEIFTTDCGCQTKVDKNTQTGSASDFEIRQNLGHVYFSWVDQSKCEKAFSFARKLKGSVVSFVDDFTHNDPNQCGSILEPDYVKDDIKRSNLEVQSTQQYCITAVNAALHYLSQQTCKDFTILWEAVVSGEVLLTKDAGSLPVKEVNIAWKVLGFDVTGSTGSVLTRPDGTYEIHIKAKLPAGSKQIILTPTKTESSGFQHTFQCDDLEKCTSKTISVEVFDFDRKYVFRDLSSVPFQGFMYIRDTNCGLAGVTVCLNDALNPTEIMACTQSGADGKYVIPAVLGANVSVTATFRNHTFVPIFQPSVVNFQITAGSPWTNINYQDNTTKVVDIEVAGGKCDIALGTATVQVKYGTCRWQQSVTIKKGSFYTRQELPAHELKFEMMNVAENSAVRGYFTTRNAATISLNLDTPPVPQSVKQAEANASVTDNQQNDRHKVRFEYHPEPTVQLTFTDNAAPDKCKTSVTFKAFETVGANIKIFENFGGSLGMCQDVDGVFLVHNRIGESLTDLNGTQVLKDKNFEPIQIQRLSTCNTPCNLTILHITSDNRVTQSFASLELMAGRPNQLLDTSGAQKSYSKMFKATAQVNGYQIPQEAWVVVTGVTAVEKTIPLSFPEYWPLMVVHDPPGGRSFASYKNAKMTVDMNLTHTKFNEDKIVKGGLWGLINPESTVCVGLGAMACQESAQGETYIGTEVDHNFQKFGEYETNKGGGFTMEISLKTSEDPATAGLASTMYLIPSLTILIEQASVVDFNKTTCSGSISRLWTWSLKSASNRNTFTWLTHQDIISTQIPEMEKVLAAEQANYTIIKVQGSPIEKASFEEKLKKLETGLAGWKKMVDQTLTTHKEAKEGTLSKVTSYRTGYFTGLAPEHLINNAQKIESDFVLPPEGTPAPEKLLPGEQESKNEIQGGVMNNFGGGIAVPTPRPTPVEVKVITTATTKVPTAGNTNVPTAGKKVKGGSAGFSSKSGMQAFVKHMAAGFPQPNTDEIYEDVFDGKLATKTQADDTMLDNVYSLSFTGGGSSFAYTIDESEIGQLTTYEDRSMAADIQVGGDVAFEIFGIGLKVAAGFTYDYLLDDKSQNTHKVTSTTTIGFTLGDPDVGDSFVVDVFIDKNYRSLVFRTVFGRSMCPREADTTAREQPTISLIPQVPSNAMPDTPIMFQVALSNAADDVANFELYMLAMTNPYGLRVLADGMNLASGQGISYSNMKKINVGVSIEVLRGPGKFEFPDVTLGFRSKCDATIDKTVNLTQINFMQPCSSVSFASPLSDQKFFLVNQKSSKNSQSLTVVVVNPDHSTRAWTAKENRLNSVKLEYRPTGTYEWYPAKNMTDGIIDFMLIQGVYGYYTAAWKTAGVVDGKYELRALAQCSLKVPGQITSPGMLSSSTSEVPGVIDRKAPEVFQTTPQAGQKFLPGSVIKIEFNEQIACVEPYIFSVKLKVGTYTTYTQTSPDLLITCQDSTISINMQRYLDYNKWVNQEIELTVGGVQDLADNAIIEDVKMKFGQFQINVKTAFITVDKLFIKGPPDAQTPVKADVLSEIGSATHVHDLSRISVHEISPQSDGAFVSFTVNPSAQDADDTPLAVVRKLHNAITTSSLIEEGGFRYLHRAVVHPNNFYSVLTPSANDKASYLEYLANKKTESDAKIPWKDLYDLLIVVVILLSALVITLAFVIHWVCSRSAKSTMPLGGEREPLLSNIDV